MFPLRDDNPRHGHAWVTWALVATNVLVFLLQLQAQAQGPFAVARLLEDWAFVPAAFFAAPALEAPTLLSSAFMHGGLGHLVSNMFFLAVFGDNVEDRMGHGRFLIFYALGGALATLAHGLVEPRSPVPLVGASGAISALLGAYILFFPRRHVLTFVPPLFVPWLVLRLLLPVPRFYLWWLPAWLYIGYWAFLQVWEAGGSLALAPAAGSGVAWWAHVGGFAFGLLAVGLFARERREGPASG